MNASVAKGSLGSGEALVPEQTPLHPIAAVNVKVRGELWERLERAANRLLHELPYSEDYILHSVTQAPGTMSHFSDWSGDMSGRWAYALTSAQRCTGKHYPKLQVIAEKLRKCQRNDGHFGKEQPLSTTDRAQIYGNGWVLLALTEYFLSTTDDGFLSAAKKLGDYYISVQDYWFDPAERSRRDESYAKDFSNFLHAIDGLALLHRVTGSAKYLVLASRMAENLLPFSESDHSHNFLSTRRGLLDLFGITGPARYLEQAEADWEIVKASAMIPTGGVFERFKDQRRDEGCSAADWLRFNLQLWQCTGKARYLDMAERILLNHLFYNQLDNGGFGHNFVAPLLSRDPQEAVWCCSMHGTHALSLLPRYLVTHGESEIVVGLYAPCQVTVPWTPPVRITLDTNSLLAGRVVVTVETTSTQKFSLKLRVPAWTALQRLVLDGTPLKGAIGDGFLRIERSWEGRTVVEMELGCGVWIEVDGVPVPPSQLRPGKAWVKASLLYGPLLLTHNVEDILSASPALLLPVDEGARIAGGLAAPLRPPMGDRGGSTAPLFEIMSAEVWGKAESVDQLIAAASIGPKRLCHLYPASERQGRFYAYPVVLIAPGPLGDRDVRKR